MSGQRKRGDGDGKGQQLLRREKRGVVCEEDVKMKQQQQQ